jgi:long-chain acyl-CoA synthetase
VKIVSHTVSFPSPLPSLPELLQSSVRKYSARVALFYYGKEMTYGELGALVEQFAAALEESGIRKGDRVAIMLPNCPQYVIAYYGIVRLGAIVVQISTMSVEREIQFFMTDAGATAMVTFAKAYPRVKNSGVMSQLKRLILVELDDEAEALAPPAIRFDEFLASSATKSLPDAGMIDPYEDVAVLQYTGGTTGRPKGVMLTHANVTANAYQCMDRVGASPSSHTIERILTVLPLFHVYGMCICLNMGILLGGTLILLPRFHLEEALQTIRDTGPTIFPGVPTMYVAINSHPKAEEYGISSIRTCVVGSASMPVPIMKQFEQRTGGIMLEGYGLSEASPVTHVNPLEKRKTGSIGTVVVGTEAKVVDVADGTRELPPGQPGELIVRGPQVMKGYWNMPEETALALRNGWLYTGDIATYDEEGYFYIVDRKKDLIIAGGYNIYPREVEEVLFSHPGIQEAAVVGIPDEYRGETVKAYIVPKEGVTLTDQDVIDFCRKHLASYKVPRIVEFRPELPKSTVGKILRRALIEGTKKDAMR